VPSGQLRARSASCPRRCDAEAGGSDDPQRRPGRGNGHQLLEARWGGRGDRVDRGDRWVRRPGARCMPCSCSRPSALRACGESRGHTCCRKRCRTSGVGRTTYGPWLGSPTGRAHNRPVGQRDPIAEDGFSLCRDVLSDPGLAWADRKLSVIRTPGRSALAPGRLRLLLLSLLLLFVGTAASAGTGRARAIEGTLMVLVIVAGVWDLHERGRERGGRCRPRRRRNSLERSGHDRANPTLAGRHDRDRGRVRRSRGLASIHGRHAPRRADG
jgi:hypothetical protein